MIFRFVVRNLRWLATVPGLPQVFDAMLLIATTLLDRERLRAMELFQQIALVEPNVEMRPHRFGGTGFFVGNNEVCHLHGNGLFDAFVGRLMRTKLVEGGDVLEHHVHPNSGWISFWIDNRAHALRALELMKVGRNYRSDQAS
jgi:hypothetical protein